MNIQKLTTLAALFSTSVSAQFVQIDESVRFSEGNEGIALSISNYAIDYLKVAYLPYIYNKIDKFELPLYRFTNKLFTGTFETTVTIPEPDQMFIKNWGTQFISSDNSLRISNKQQDITLTSQVQIQFAPHVFLSGNITDKISDLDFQFDLGFLTQDAKFVEATGHEQGSEMAPAIDIDNIVLNTDTLKQDVKIEGFLYTGIADLIVNEFSDYFDKEIIKGIEKQIETTLVDEINKELFEYGTHFDLGSEIGFDYSLTQPPTVTDDAMLTLFMNGTFFSSVAQSGLSDIVETEHPIFEIGGTSQQDLMLHVSQSVIDSGFNTIAARNGFNLSDFQQTVYGEPLTLGSKTMQWISKKVSESGDADTPVDVILYLNKTGTVEITEDNIEVNQTARFVINDQSGSLYTDFSLEDINFNMDITSQANLTLIENNVNNFQFQDQHINRQGSVHFDIREVMRDNSAAFDNNDEYIGKYFGSRNKQMNPLVFFEEMEMKLSDGLIFAGLTFDFLYLGRPQNWNTAD